MYLGMLRTVSVCKQLEPHLPRLISPSRLKGRCKKTQTIISSQCIRKDPTKLLIVKV